MTRDGIIARLNERKQRATYGAITGIVGGLPRGLMAHLERNPTNSWVVARSGPRRGWPTGYNNNQIHPDYLRQILTGLDNVIEDSETLGRWLSS